MYKLISFNFEGKPVVEDGNYVQWVNVHVGTQDDKMSQWFQTKTSVPMTQQVGDLIAVQADIERQVNEYVTLNFNS